MSAVALTAGLAVAGCAPVKMGSAAIVGDQQISLAKLNTTAGWLSTAAKKYPSVVQLTPQQITQDSLTWLIQFQIADQLAKNEGISVSYAEQNAAFDSLYTQQKQAAAADGVANLSTEEFLAHSGIAPQLWLELGQYEAIQTDYLTQANGGTPPTTQAAQTAAESKLTHAFCLTAKSLNIQVNPQFGRMDYTSYSVVSAPDTVSRTAGPVTSSSSSTEGLTPAC